MITKLSICLLLASFTYASAQESFIDIDMDGVEDSIDKCLDSAMTDIVDETGCLVEKLSYKKEQHFDVSIGYGYSKFDDTLSQKSQSLSFSYYYAKDWSFSLYTSTYDVQSGQSGLDDTSMSLTYNTRYHDIFTSYSIGSYLPTYDDSTNKSDYFLSLSLTKTIQEIDISTQLQHTFMQDTNTKDTNLLSFLVAKEYDRYYTSLSYTIQNSYYKDSGNLETFSLFVNYFFTDDFFIDTSLSYGLNTNTTDYTIQTALGYSY